MIKKVKQKEDRNGRFFRSIKIMGHTVSFDNEGFAQVPTDLANFLCKIKNFTIEKEEEKKEFVQKGLFE